MTAYSYKFHPVGQGLFYSGRIDGFNFVYDCGTSSDNIFLSNSIDSLKNELKNHKANKLDLLIISHFDKDHINGIETLLISLRGVRNVVLPYLYPEERLMLAFECQSNGEGDSSYFKFLLDPFKFLDQFNIENVIFIPPEKPVEKWNSDSIQNEKTFSWSGAISDASEYEIIKGSKKKTHHVTFRSHSNILSNGFYTFKFYCKPQKIGKEEIVHELKAQELSLSKITIQDMVEKQFINLESVYKKLFKKKQNPISLICCHGPIDNYLKKSMASILITSIFTNAPIYKKTMCPEFYCCNNGNIDIKLVRSSLFQMLTGDAEISLKEYKQHYSEEIQNVLLFSIPHHGSKKNWKKEFIDIHAKCMLWPCSFGLNNEYKHPSNSVISDIIEANRIFCVVNQVEGKCLYIMLQ
jgi:hypothetical protein